MPNLTNDAGEIVNFSCTCGAEVCNLDHKLGSTCSVCGDPVTMRCVILLDALKSALPENATALAADIAQYGSL